MCRPRRRHRHELLLLADLSEFRQSTVNSTKRGVSCATTGQSAPAPSIGSRQRGHAQRDRRPAERSPRNTDQAPFPPLAVLDRREEPALGELRARRAGRPASPPSRPSTPTARNAAARLGGRVRARRESAMPRIVGRVARRAPARAAPAARRRRPTARSSRRPSGTRRWARTATSSFGRIDREIAGSRLAAATNSLKCDDHQVGHGEVEAHAGVPDRARPPTPR